MTESQRVAYAKTFIDKLANGINPLSDEPLPEGDVANNVRLSRCFFYVSDILRREIERERRKERRAAGETAEKKPAPEPFFITPRQVEAFQYSATPISVSAMCRKLNWLVREEIGEKRMERLSFRRISTFLKKSGMIEWQEWEGGMMKWLPTSAGEEMGLTVQLWERYGRRTPMICLTETAQHFVMDNIEAVLATDGQEVPSCEGE